VLVADCLLECYHALINIGLQDTNVVVSRRHVIVEKEVFYPCTYCERNMHSGVTHSIMACLPRMGEEVLCVGTRAAVRREGEHTVEFDPFYEECVLISEDCSYREEVGMLSGVFCMISSWKARPITIVNLHLTSSGKEIFKVPFTLLRQINIDQPVASREEQTQDEHRNGLNYAMSHTIESLHPSLLTSKLNKTAHLYFGISELYSQPLCGWKPY